MHSILSMMRFCVALMTYSLFFFQCTNSQISIWYEQMAGNPPGGNAWTGTSTPASVYNWGYCPSGGNYCWFYQSDVGYYQLSVSTTAYTSVQLLYSIKAMELSGIESCYIHYSVDGSNFNPIETITKDSGYIEAIAQTYDSWTDAAGVTSLTIRFGCSKSGAVCTFNEFRLSGTTASPSKYPTGSPSKDPTVSPSIHPTVSPSKYPTASPSTSNPTSPSATPSRHPSAFPSNHPSITPSIDPTAYPTNPSVHPTVSPSMHPTTVTTYPTYAPTPPPSCGGSQVCSETTLQPVHDSYETAYIGKKGYGFNARNIDYVFTFTIIGDTPCIRPRLRVLWQRIPNYLTAYVNGVRADSCSSSSSSCGSYYYCIGDSYTGYNIDSSSTPYYAGTQWTILLDHSADRACSLSGSYVHLAVEVQLRCYGWTPAPTASPTLPTLNPSATPTITSLDPTNAPSFAPTSQSVPPTNAPSSAPTVSTENPTLAPSQSPTLAPSNVPTFAPTDAPSSTPTLAPSSPPTLAPSDTPSSPPTLAPSQNPTASTLTPTRQPTVRRPCGSPTYGTRYFCYDHFIEPVLGIPVSKSVTVQENDWLGYTVYFDVSWTITGSNACLNASFDFDFEIQTTTRGGWMRVSYDTAVIDTFYDRTSTCGEWRTGISEYMLAEQFDVGQVVTLRLYKDGYWGFHTSCALAEDSIFTLYCGNRTPDPTTSPTTGAPTINTAAPTTAIPTSTTSQPTTTPTMGPTTPPTRSTSAPSKPPTRSPTNTPTVPSSAPTDAPTAVSDAPTRQTKAPTTTKSPTPAPTSELCTRADAFCYTVDVYSTSTNESTSYSVDIQNMDGGETEIYDVYFTARNGACYAPSIGLNYTAMYDANALTILDANDHIMTHCQTDKQCGSYSECLTDYDLGIGVLYEKKTYLLTVFGRYLSNECNGTDTVDMKIDFVCGAIPPPSVSPTGHPIAPTSSTTTTTIIATNSVDNSGWFSTDTKKEDGQLGVSDMIEENMVIVIAAIGVLIALGVVACVCKWKKKKTNERQRLEQNVQSEDDATDIQGKVLMELGKVLQSENETQAMTGSTNTTAAVAIDSDIDA
eukprot:117491_1